MNDLERYLKQASRGLPRRERERVREELRSSILERAAEHQVGGATKQDALQLALREFGDPAPLGAGMRRIHLWPQVGFLSGLAAVTLSLVILNWPNALGQQVQVTTEGLVPRCTSSGPPAGAKLCHAQKGAWVNTNSLKKQLQKQGVQVTVTDQPLPVPPGWIIPGHVLQETYMRATWTEGGQPQSFEFPITDARGKAFQDHRRRLRPASPVGFESFYPPLESVFQRGSITYVDIQLLLVAVQESATLPVSIENPLGAPVLRIGQVTLVLGEAQQGIELTSPIRQRVTRLLATEFGASVDYVKHYLPQPDVLLSQASGVSQQTKVKGKPGEVYAILFPVTVNQGNGLGFDLASVDESGVLHFRTAQTSVRFTSDIKALANSGQGKAAVALLRLGNRITLERSAPFWHQVEVP